MDKKQIIGIAMAVLVLSVIGVAYMDSQKPVHKHFGNDKYARSDAIDGTDFNERSIVAEEKLATTLEQQLIDKGISKEEAYKQAWVCPVCNKVVYERI